MGMGRPPYTITEKAADYRGADSDEGTQRVHKRAALTEQRVENAVSENTGDRVGHDVARIGKFLNEVEILISDIMTTRQITTCR